MSTPNIGNSQHPLNPYKQVDPDLPKTSPIGTPLIDIKCGPLLRFWGLNDTKQDVWRGSVLIVTNDSTSDYSTPPFLSLNVEQLGPAGAPAGVSAAVPDGLSDGINGGVNNEIGGPSAYSGDTSSPNGIPNDYDISGSGGPAAKPITIQSVNLFKEYGVTFWRFDLNLDLTDCEQKVGYIINQHQSPDIPSFFIPSRHQDMNIMFYSCNGFSLGVTPEKFKGQLWDDVLNQHENQNHFHVMLGGGDQLYCDKVKVASDSIAKWSQEKNPIKKRNKQVEDGDRVEIEQFYLWHYISWFGLGYFKGPHGKTRQYGWPKALARIPMINVYDDHDIIDGFGSYTDGIMSAPYFEAIGRSAFKYYLLFQQCVAPNEPTSKEPSWLLSPKPGPYMGENGRSIYARLGPSIAFFGLDCRTERTNRVVASDGTYRAMFERLNHEVKQSNGQIKHLILMLGVPIAYPRMVWLERILTSDLMIPIKLLTRRGVFSGLSNEFDDGIEILDDLDDHWCARHHKKERNRFVSLLQEFSHQTSVRVTILGGDVHLAGIGRFYARNATPPEKDYRHMLNIISSAIVNTPPPDKLADFLNKRSKIHHFGSDTNEDMVKIFPVDVNNVPRNNERLLPRRNWCSIIPTYGRGEARKPGQVLTLGSPPVSNPHEKVYQDLPGTLSVVLHMEKDQNSVDNVTIPYEVLVPTLQQ